MPLFCCFILLAISITTFNTVAELPLLPYPAKVQQSAGRFDVTAEFSVSVPEGSPMLAEASHRFLKRLSHQTGLTMSQGRSTPKLFLQITNDNTPIPQADMAEQYQLVVTSQQITLTAASAVGIVRGLETLLQLVQTDDAGSTIATLHINDQPRFSWRGVLLDPARRFIPVETLKRQLDVMATVKLNVLHLHLTDDQGWRFESLHYPKLQQIAGRDGYYTQQQLRDLVQYAAQRGIRIVPEIDLPGHTTALGAAYPELMSMPGPNHPETHWGVHQAVLDPSNEQVYDFLTNLLSEVTAVFPDRYLHIGGDEVLPDHWLGAPHIVDFMQQQQLPDAPALQAYFNLRLQHIVQQLDRQMIGWDEVLDDRLPTSVLVQSWRGTESLAGAAKAGHQAILSTGYYLDQPQFASYHYRNDPLPDAEKMPDSDLVQYWSAWQFNFQRKRGAAISAKLVLLYHTDNTISAILTFAGRQPQVAQQLILNANKLSFTLDSWMGPLSAEFELNNHSGTDDTTNVVLNGKLTVGNAAYAVSGNAIALAQESTTAMPMTWQQQTLDDKSKARIIGGEIALWGELVTPKNIDIRLWPNGFAVAERLWSPAELRDENSLYNRLSKHSKRTENNGSLLTSAQHLQGLSTLVSSDKLPALLTLSQTLEPAHYYHRLHEKSVAGQYHNGEPLDRLVDYLPAEQPELRQFTHDIRQWLVNKDSDSLKRLMSKLLQWQQAAVTVNQNASDALIGLSLQVLQLSQSGQTLLNSISQQQPLLAAERAKIRQQLANASTIEKEMIIALHRPLALLLEQAPHSEIWQNAGTFSLSAEGPAFDSSGNFYAVNFGHDGTVGKITADGVASLYLTLPEGSTGNGIVFDNAGTMYIADYTGHNIIKYQAGELSVHAHNDDMNQPNDLTIMQNGILFASDPNWADSSGQLWRINTDGSNKLLAADMGTTNGIAVSPDQQYLYINESVQRRIWRFKINDDFSLGNKQLVAHFSDFGLDGMRFDRAGNLYVARYGKGTIAKLNASGELLAEYRLNHPLPTNVSLNNNDSYLYVTIQQCGCIERIALKP
ncbi:family 20 glycosylhydrolase [Rheinheimera baltica]|uniref:family 20 glycosylhydrolase n=1 Tax=Rheinheimera baltica TaxID=67576 RepID=UPI00273E9244|nr:family 20 glycosylhydrolase [Rheinheimera baltica]MDP5148917.1 family 20 glycosylhydrolase [Rheinheimera baltica]